MHQGFKRRETDRLIYAVPSQKTAYGDIIADEVIIQVIDNGMKHEDAAVASIKKRILFDADCPSGG